MLNFLIGMLSVRVIDDRDPHVDFLPRRPFAGTFDPRRKRAGGQDAIETSFFRNGIQLTDQATGRSRKCDRGVPKCRTGGSSHRTLAANPTVSVWTAPSTGFDKKPMASPGYSCAWANGTLWAKRHRGFGYGHGQALYGKSQGTWATTPRGNTAPSKLRTISRLHLTPDRRRPHGSVS